MTTVINKKIARVVLKRKLAELIMEMKTEVYVPASQWGESYMVKFDADSLGPHGFTVTKTLASPWNEDEETLLKTMRSLPQTIHELWDAVLDRAEVKEATDRHWSVLEKLGHPKY
jgi:hypothetical protein